MQNGQAYTAPQYAWRAQAGIRNAYNIIWPATMVAPHHLNVTFYLDDSPSLAQHMAFPTQLLRRLLKQNCVLQLYSYLVVDLVLKC